MAEAAWSDSPDAWSGYRCRLGTHSPLWRRRDLRYFAATSLAWA